jgi:hypothetical protein
MYYVLQSDNDDTGPMIMRHAKLPFLERIVFDRGLLIQEEIPPFDLHMDAETQGELLDYVWVTLSGIVISGRFRNLLDALGVNNIQYFPIRILNDVTKEAHPDYYVANVVGRIACLDFETSKLTHRVALPNKIRSIEEMHLIEANIYGQAIFRLDEWAAITICNEAIRDASIKAGIRGCMFIPAEGYST